MCCSHVIIENCSMNFDGPEINNTKEETIHVSPMLPHYFSDIIFASTLAVKFASDLFKSDNRRKDFQSPTHSTSKYTHVLSRMVLVGPVGSCLS